MRQFISVFALIPVLLLLQSCGLDYYMKKGIVEQNSYEEKIPFEYSKNLIIINVELGGKNRRFLFDTGAPNIISNELQDELKFKIKLSNGATDSQGKRSVLDFVYLKNLKIGRIEFNKSIAAVADLRTSEVFECLNLDGIIGSNLMDKANWTIDYQKQEISFTDKKNLAIQNSCDFSIPFSQNFQKTPHIDIGIGSQKLENLTFDLGSSGGISVKNDELQNSFKQIKEYGVVSASLYGTVSDTVYYRYGNPLILGKRSFGPYWVKCYGKSTGTVGNKVWENFQLGINFSLKTIYLKKISDPKSSKSSFGFEIFYEEGKWKVSSVLLEGMAYDYGLRPGDEILQLNDINLEDITLDDYCRYLMNDQLIPKGDDLFLIYKSQETEEERELELIRQEFFTY